MPSSLPLFNELSFDAPAREPDSPPQRQDDKLSADGLAEYLAIHPDLKGIGPAKAKILADRFGRDFAGACKRQRAEMALAAGVPGETIERLAELWLSEAGARGKTRLWLASLGLTYAQVTTIEGKYKEGARAVLEHNPYILAREVKGFGFSKADAIAKLAGVAPSSEPRIEACSEYVVRECQSDGHVWIGFGDAAKRIGKLLELWDARERIEATVSRLVYEGKLTGTWIDPETWALSTAELFRQERECSFVLRAMGRKANRWRQAMSNAPPGPTEGQLTERQRDALTIASMAQVCVVTGGAGTGKTFTMAAIARRYQAAGLKIALAAPTGKAAKRMGEMHLEDVTPQTLHRLLGYDGKGFGRRKGQQAATKSESEGSSEEVAEVGPPTGSQAVDADALLVDEASMIDVALLYELLRGVDLGRTAIVFFGDPHQLPSVGPGSVLRDLIERAVVPVVKLEVVMRQAGVLKAASMGVLEGKIAGSTKETVAKGLEGGPMAAHNTWPWVVLRKKGDGAVAEAVEKLFGEDLPAKLGVLPEEIQVISPSYKGDAGVDALNARLQRVAQAKRGVEIVVDGRRPRPKVGDRVIQTRNNYELGEDGVMNGAVGILKGQEVGVQGQVLGWRVKMDDEDLLYDPGQVRQLELAYALTVHKAQGSEFPVVIVVVSRSHSFMLHRNLLYTAVTRAQKMVVLVGDEAGMIGAVRKTIIEKRRTFLGALKEREAYRPNWFEVVV